MKKVMTILAAALVMVACGQKQAAPAEEEAAANPADAILLKNFRPVNVNNIPETFVEKAKYPVIDMHSHDYATNEADVDQWVKNMDECGIEVTNVMHCAWIGDPLEDYMKRYAKYPDRFKFWCCFDYTDMVKDGTADRTLAYLEKCHDLGAVGIGEMGDKGEGDLYARPVEGRGIHIDDPRLKPVLQKCAELKMPISIHIGEPYWMYLPMDSTNDGLPNGAVWHVDSTKVGCLGYWGLMKSFENAVRENPNVIFIACHFLNMNQDYEYLGNLLDKYPNLYVDIAARTAEAAQTPRATRKFIMKYQDRILFGTDNGMEKSMYQTIFRVLETEDEHFYCHSFNYHWYLNGFYLPDEVLEKIYRTNALRILNEYK